MVFLVIGGMIGMAISVIFGKFFIFLISVTAALILSSIPWDGYETKCVKEVELIQLKTRNKCYVKRFEENNYVYAYDNRKKYNLTNEAYEEVVIKGKVKIYESDKCEVPIFKKFVSSPKTEFYTSFKLFKKTEYVFQVPIGTALDSWEANIHHSSD